MVEAFHPSDLTPWIPTATEIPDKWMALLQKLLQSAKSLRYAYIMEDVRYNAQHIGDKLRSWGLPWPVVVAGYLWGSDEEQIRYEVEDAGEVLRHINETSKYIRSIADEDLLSLLNPPYRDLGALLIAVIAYYQALLTLQEQSNGRPYAGTKQSHIESVGRTLLNIAKLLGMWQFKREVEDLIEQLRSPRKFEEAKQEHLRILAQDANLLEDARQLLIALYQEATKQPIIVTCIPCGIAGMKRRLQDAHTTETSHKAQLIGFDLVTFNVTVSSIYACYTALGALSQLGYIQDRVTDQIANPKPNGYSHIALGLILKPQNTGKYVLKWPETYTYICQLQIATDVMQAIMWYGCLYPDCYELHIHPPLKEEVRPPSVEQMWISKEGKALFAIKELLSKDQHQPEANAPIVVYNKSRKPIKLPKGATALDFAYKSDSAMGERSVEAFINNRKAPLYRVLEAGDVVEIRTASEIQAQDYWLHKSYTITPLAQSQIKKSLQRRYPARRGYDLIRQELERYHYMLSPEELDYELHMLVEHSKFDSLPAYLELLDKKGEPPYTPSWAAQTIITHITERSEPLSTEKEKVSWAPVLDMNLTTNRSFIQQQYLCSFCQPRYPRDMKIMGRLHKRSGKLVVHKETCPHLIDRSNGSNSILLPMTWQPQPPRFKVAFFIITQDRKGLILDLTRQLRRHQCNLLSIYAEPPNNWGEARLRFTLETHTDKEVMDIWQELHKIEGVLKAEINAATTPPFVYERLQKLRRQKSLSNETSTLDITLIEWLPSEQPRAPFLHNPFNISRPATAKMFFGRSTETWRMQRDLCDEKQGRALILHGPRRSGKSSICKNFLECHIQPPYWGVLFSLQNASHQAEESIFTQLAEKICAEFSRQLQQAAYGWHNYNDEDPQIRFRRVLQGCIDQVPDARLVLALDEFGGALESYENRILEYRFFTYWKELMNDLPQLSLILALPTDAHRLLNSRTFAHVFNFADHLPITFLDTKSARQVLVDPLKDQNIAIHPNTVALAVKMTGGNPYYLTIIGHRLIRQLNLVKEKQLITDDDLNLVIDQLIAEGSSQNFIFLRQEIQNKAELNVLESIVELTKHSKQPKIQLKRIATKLDLPLSVISQHLARLRIGLILEENGHSTNPYYSFKIELVRRWLERNGWFFSDPTQRLENFYGE